MVDAGAGTTGVPAAEEATLVAQVRAGDLSAFEALIRPYENRIYRAILRITRDPSSAADVYQDALLAAFEKLASFRGDAAFGSWLQRIAMNLALMRRRAPAHHRVVSEDDLPKKAREAARSISPGVAKRGTPPYPKEPVAATLRSPLAEQS